MYSARPDGPLRYVPIVPLAVRIPTVVADAFDPPADGELEAAVAPAFELELLLLPQPAITSPTPATAAIPTAPSFARLPPVI
jgi:hypothetical protein